MSAQPPGGTPPRPPPLSARRRRNISLVVIAGAVAIAVVVAVVLLRPPAPPSCPIYTRCFTLIAGKGGSLTFNGTQPGPTISVPLNVMVRLTLTNDPTSGITHSFMVVPQGGTPASPVVFPGANTTNPTSGLPPGVSETITFRPDRMGTFEYICGVDGHAAAGMRGPFVVTPG